MEKAFFEIIGMHCPPGQARIEMALSQMKGIKEAQINFLKIKFL